VLLPEGSALLSLDENHGLRRGMKFPGFRGGTSRWWDLDSWKVSSTTVSLPKLGGECDAPDIGRLTCVHDVDALDTDSAESERLVDLLANAHADEISTFLEDSKLGCNGSERSEESVFKFGRCRYRRDRRHGDCPGINKDVSAGLTARGAHYLSIVKLPNDRSGHRFFGLWNSKSVRLQRRRCISLVTQPAEGDTSGHRGYYGKQRNVHAHRLIRRVDSQRSFRSLTIECSGRVQ
jgi:hypothetical protein